MALIVLFQGRLRELADVRKAPLVFAGGVVVSVVALGLQLLAFQQVWVGLVESLKRGIGNAMALILGYFVFRESITARKLAAVGLMAFGVGLILS